MIQKRLPYQGSANMTMRHIMAFEKQTGINSEKLPFISVCLSIDMRVYIGRRVLSRASATLAQQSRPVWLAQAAQGFAFDLANSLARQPKLLPNLLQRVRAVLPQPEA